MPGLCGKPLFPTCLQYRSSFSRCLQGPTPTPRHPGKLKPRTSFLLLALPRDMAEVRRAAVVANATTVLNRRTVPLDSIEQPAFQNASDRFAVTQQVDRSYMPQSCGGITCLIAQQRTLRPLPC